MLTQQPLKWQRTGADSNFVRKREFEFVMTHFTPLGKPWSAHPRGGGGSQAAMVRRHIAQALRESPTDKIEETGFDSHSGGQDWQGTSKNDDVFPNENVSQPTQPKQNSSWRPWLL